MKVNTGSGMKPNSFRPIPYVRLLVFRSSSRVWADSPWQRDSGPDL
jgi:hypothetical protein